MRAVQAYSKIGVCCLHAYMHVQIQSCVHLCSDLPWSPSAVPDTPTLTAVSGVHTITVDINTENSSNWTVSQYCTTLNAVPMATLNWTLTFQTRTKCDSTVTHVYTGLEEFTQYTISAWVTNMAKQSSQNTTLIVRTNATCELTVIKLITLECFSLANQKAAKSCVLKNIYFAIGNYHYHYHVFDNTHMLKNL